MRRRLCHPPWGAGASQYGWDLSPIEDAAAPPQPEIRCRFRIKGPSMTNIWRQTAITAAAMTCLAAAPAGAVESGLSPYLKGLAGFMSGLQPPQQGFYLSNIYYHFSGTSEANARAGAVELDVGINLDVGLVES